MKYKYLLMIISINTSHAFITVGTDANCTNLTDTIDSSILVNDEIRITNQQQYQPIFAHAKDVKIIGGYDNCLEASANTLGQNGKSIISGNNNFSSIIVTTHTNTPTIYQVHLENLEVINGEATNGTGGGIYLSNRLNVVMENISIHDNHAVSKGGGLAIVNGAILNGESYYMPVLINNLEVYDNATGTGGKGGGISITGKSNVVIENSDIRFNTANSGGGLNFGSTDLTIIDSSIQNNSATVTGGGIKCSSGSATITGNSKISFNQATTGGGLSISTSCRVISTMGDTQNLQNAQYGINNNTALYNGGGVSLAQGGRIDLIGNGNHYANLLNNNVENITGSGTAEGGGIFASGDDTYARLINARVSGNSARSKGSAVYVSDFAKVHMRRASGTGFGNQITSEIAHNDLTIEGEGVLAADTCGSFEIYQTEIHHNTLQGPGVLKRFVSLNGVNFSSSCESIFEGNVFYKNDANFGSLFYLDKRYTLDFAYNSVADNFVDSIFKIGNDNNSNQTLNINSSIFWNDPSPLVEETGNHNYSGNCIGAFDINEPIIAEILAAGDSAVYDYNPNFTDAANGDYSPQSPTYADLCNLALHQPRYHDIEGKVRGIDIFPNINTLGPYDAGAFEYDTAHINDVIFQDGFE